MESYIMGLEILLASSWLNMMLYMLEITFICRYFSNFPTDRRIHRFIVYSSLLFDTISTAAICANVWLYLITFGDQPPSEQIWTLPTTIISTSGSAVLEQGFLIYRFWKLCEAGCQINSSTYSLLRSRNILMTGLLCLLSLTHTLFGLISGIYISLHPQFEPNLAVTATTVSNCTSAATDISIALSLVWQLHGVKSSFHSTQSLIRRLTINAITSGFGVALITLLMMVLFLVKTAAFNIFFSILGRLYSITILVNLCTRIRKRRHSYSTTRSSMDISRSMDLTSIHVQQSTVYRIDDGSSAPRDTPVREAITQKVEAIRTQSPETSSSTKSLPLDSSNRHPIFETHSAS